jgi:hypothetical protein
MVRLSADVNPLRESRRVTELGEVFDPAAQQVAA